MSLVATFDVETKGSSSTTSATAAAATAADSSSSRSRLRHSIYLGGKADAKDWEKLVNRWKITHVLNCTPAKETNIEAGVPNYFEHRTFPGQKQRFVYHRIPIYDAPSSLQELKSEHASDIVRFVTKGLCHGNVLVHCSRGVSRSTTSVVLYLMAKRDYTYDDAIAMIRRRRPQALPIPAFETWLRERDIYYRTKKISETAAKPTIAAATATTTMPTTTTAMGPQPPPPTPTKKRKMQATAMIGPSPPPSSTIGPSPPPPSIGPSPPPNTASKATSIGPELPSTRVSEKKKKQGPPKPSIGPALPP